jgi:hypothetical protein
MNDDLGISSRFTITFIIRYYANNYDYGFSVHTVANMPDPTSTIRGRCKSSALICATAEYISIMLCVCFT